MAGYRKTASISTPFPEGVVDFDPEKFDEVISGAGVELEHWRALRCPVGMIDPDDTLRRPHEHHEGCSNGFIYTKVGCFRGLFSGNSMNSDPRDTGVADASTAQITCPRFYAGTEDNPTCRDEVLLAPYDRLYYANAAFVVPNWELIEAHPTGKDRLSFPAERVNIVIDANGKRYSPADFDVVNGWIHWKGQNQPGFNAETGKGVVYSVHYVYRPFWYVQRLGHEIRVANIDDGRGERVTERMPQSATIQREYVYLNQERDPVNSGDARQHREPADGSFPAR